MEYRDEKEEKLLDEMYPEGSLERKVLNYSRAKKAQEEVPPMLVGAFKVLMGITVMMALASLVAFLSH